MKVFQVGGSLRDEMLGLPVTERDWVVVGSSPEAMIRQGFRPVGKDFPVFLHPETHEEYALARTERKTAPGYHGFVFHASPNVGLEEDLARRDLTINAMARAADGTLFDPFGGQADLAERRLRHVGPAFVEDPVRLLRVARFLAKLAPFRFETAPPTVALLRHMVSAGEVDALVPERVQQELDKGFQTLHPSHMLRALHAWGALSRLFPNLPSEHLEPSLQAVDGCARHNLPQRQRWIAWLSTLLGPLPDPQRQSLMADWGERYRWSREKVQLITLACTLGPSLRHLDARTPESWLPIFDRYDAWRRPARFLESLDLQVCLAELFQDGHPDLKTNGQKALDICLALDSAAIARATTDPRTIPELLRQQRLSALRSLIP